MRIALYRGSGIVSKIILWQSRGKFSHASVVLPDNSVIESREFIGVHKMPAVIPEKGETFKLFNVETTPIQDMAIVAFLEGQVGKDYDYLSILRFITRENTDRYTRNYWFCSELVFSAFRHAGINLLERIDAWAVSPELLSLSPFLKPL